MSSLVAENDEQPSSSNMTQLDHSVTAVESHNTPSEESSAEISTQAIARLDTQHAANDAAPISEAAHPPTDKQSTGKKTEIFHSSGTDGANETLSGLRRTQQTKRRRRPHPGSLVLSFGLLILLLADFTVPLFVTI